MIETTMKCPMCDGVATLVQVPTRVKRGERVLTVALDTWRCVGTCKSADGERPLGFVNQALARRNDEQVRAAWLTAFNEELPEPKRPGRKPQEPRIRTVQVKLSESELRDLDLQRGTMTRSEYIRAQALAPHRRSA